MNIDKNRFKKALIGHHKMMLKIWVIVYIGCCFVKWKLVNPLYYFFLLVDYIPNTNENGRLCVLTVACVVMFYYVLVLCYRYDNLKEE